MYQLVVRTSLLVFGACSFVGCSNELRECPVGLCERIEQLAIGKFSDTPTALDRHYQVITVASEGLRQLRQQRKCRQLRGQDWRDLGRENSLR